MSGDLDGLERIYTAGKSEGNSSVGDTVIRNWPSLLSNLSRIGFDIIVVGDVCCGGGCQDGETEDGV